MKALLLAIIAALLVGAPQLARAAGDEAAQAKAKVRIKKARQYYEASKFDQAIAEYSAAYKLVAAPDILFNIATILEVKGDQRRALGFYLKYLDVEPEGRLADSARTKAEERTGELLSDELKAKYSDALAKTTPEARASDPAWKALFSKVAAGEQDLGDAVAAVVPKPKAPPKPAPKPIEEGEAVATVVAAPPPKPKRAPRPTPPILKKWWFWTAVGGGAAVVLTIGLAAGLSSGQSDPQATLGVLR